MFYASALAAHARRYSGSGPLSYRTWRARVSSGQAVAESRSISAPPAAFIASPPAEGHGATAGDGAVDLLRRRTAGQRLSGPWPARVEPVEDLRIPAQVGRPSNPWLWVVTPPHGQPILRTRPSHADFPGTAIASPQNRSRS